MEWKSALLFKEHLFVELMDFLILLQRINMIYQRQLEYKILEKSFPETWILWEYASFSEYKNRLLWILTLTISISNFKSSKGNVYKYTHLKVGQQSIFHQLSI